MIDGTRIREVHETASVLISDGERGLFCMARRDAPVSALCSRETNKPDIKAVAPYEQFPGSCFGRVKQSVRERKTGHCGLEEFLEGKNRRVCTLNAPAHFERRASETFQRKIQHANFKEKPNALF